MIILYARVSSKEQEEGYSIPAQLDLLRDYAKRNKIKIDRELVDVESASKTGRSGFNQMVKFLKKSRERIVLVEKTDRLYRNLRDWVTIDEINPTVHFVKENVVLAPDSKSMEKFVHGIKVLLARQYTQNLSEEVKKGMNKKAEMGYYPSWTPIGYNSGKPCMGPDPERAPLIRHAYQLRASGMTLKVVHAEVLKLGMTVVSRSLWKLV